ncbi:MAG: hypothetical protein JO261_09290 [Alphaproteobacteria bacterium]|nr:hypothetical protein [Alphaproteobacteria bacterium]MBV9693884.1 hypothetical protein [Alphaproteobacteria bacterium]
MTIAQFGMLAGFLMIAVAAGLAYKQNLTWQHVIVFAFGAVLAGVSGIQIKVGDNSVNIGALQAQTVTQIANSSDAQQKTLAALNDRMDKLQAAIDAISKTAPGQAPSPQIRELLSKAALSAVAVKTSLTKSSALSMNVRDAAAKWNAVAAVESRK